MTEVTQNIVINDPIGTPFYWWYHYLYDLSKCRIIWQNTCLTLIQTNDMRHMNMTDKYQYNVMDMLLNGLVMSPDIEHKIQGPSGHVMSEKINIILLVYGNNCLLLLTIWGTFVDSSRWKVVMSIPPPPPPGTCAIKVVLFFKYCNTHFLNVHQHGLDYKKQGTEFWMISSHITYNTHYQDWNLYHMACLRIHHISYITLTWVNVFCAMMLDWNYISITY